MGNILDLQWFDNICGHRAKLSFLLLILFFYVFMAVLVMSLNTFNVWTLEAITSMQPRIPAASILLNSTDVLDLHF